ncbi:MAG TPA: hypothetical protein VI197_00170 [Polyangiaceae bacterium]
MTLEALIEQARVCVEMEQALDRELLLALDAARGSSLCFLDELELEVLAARGPAGITECSEGSRLCVAADSEPHPLVVIRSREVQLESLARQRAPAVLLRHLERELDELRAASEEVFDWSSIRRYPEDAALFPAYVHDLRWIRAIGSIVVADSSPGEAVRLYTELEGPGAYLTKRAPSGHGRPSATHFLECALDFLSQTRQGSDQDLMPEIAVAALMATTHADARSAWRRFVDVWWSTWQVE